ncbi:MAG: hypothetical protein M0C28_28690 [Candidatus Moduliflexus flocculans]|nr:hypothetical protein [Candidatus Moduliflexus flocculans]
MTNIPRITLIIILLSIPLAACVLVISALFPNRLARDKIGGRIMPGRAFSWVWSIVRSLAQSPWFC